MAAPRGAVSLETSGGSKWEVALLDRSARLQETVFCFAAFCALVRSSRERAVAQVAHVEFRAAESPCVAVLWEVLRRGRRRRLH